MFLKYCIAIAACLLASAANASWRVTEASSIGFVSIKNNTIGENNSFTKVSGVISDVGRVRLNIHLSSVHTGIGIRDDRLKAIAFDVANFPVAAVEAELNEGQVATLSAGSKGVEIVSVDISFRGKTVSKVAHLVVSISDSDIRVTTAQPIVVTAQEFGLEAGVAALQQIAGLKSISRSIPVTLDLRLTAD